MISGTVFPDRQARLTVELLSADGQFQPFEFILDTGFTGDLSLPRQTLQQLAVAPAGGTLLELADGSQTSTPTWWATAIKPNGAFTLPCEYPYLVGHCPLGH